MRRRTGKSATRNKKYLPPAAIVKGMKFFFVAACLVCTLFTQILPAAVLPVLHLDTKTLQAFDAYVAKFEKETFKPYADSGKMSMDSSSCCLRNSAFKSGKPVLEAHENGDVASGSIHHFTGMMHLDHGRIEDVRHIMEDYPNYPRYFKPDVTKGSGTAEADSAPADEHYFAHLTLAESTLWFNVEYECVYDTHYRKLDENHWMSKSTTASVKEMRDAKDPAKGYFPEGDDHGFVWRTNTYWFVRQSGGGIDVEVNSLTLSRPNVTGFGWFGSKRSRDAVEKMLRDTRTAVNAMR